MILKEGEGYKIEFKEGFNPLQRAVIRMHEPNKPPQSAAIRCEEVLLQRHGTRMTRIGRIFTDIFDPCVSASSVQSVFYRNPATIDDDKEPQIDTEGSELLFLCVLRASEANILCQKPDYFTIPAFSRPVARARAACACRSSVAERRRRMKVEGMMITKIGARSRLNLCDIKVKYMNEKIIYKDDEL